MADLFAVPVFFITFRESLETAIIVSVLIAFIKRTLVSENDHALYKKLVRQVWLGTAIGVVVCIIIGVALITGFYGLGPEQWAGTEDIWEGVFALVASAIITVMGAVLLRVSKLQDKWRAKLATALNPKKDRGVSLSLGNRFKQFGEEYALFLLPLVTVLREGFEGVIFIAGVGLGFPPSSIPLPAIIGLLTGAVCGVLIYKGSNHAPIQYFLIFSTCFLYLVAAGLFSKGVWHLEANQWNKIVGGDAAELGSGPGSYDITKSVWHVNCCNPDLNGGGAWGIFNAILGWQNSATIGSVVAYNLYWVAVTVGFLVLIRKEKKVQRHVSESGTQLDGDRRPLLEDSTN